MVFQLKKEKWQLHLQYVPEETAFSDEHHRETWMLVNN